MRMTTFVLAAALSCSAVAATAQDTTVNDICDDEATSDSEECVALPVAGDATNFLGFLPFLAGAGAGVAGILAASDSTSSTVDTTN